MQPGSPIPSPAGPQLSESVSEDEFYRYPTDLPSADPGRLVRLQALEVPAGVRGWRVLYHSNSVDGRDVVVSGVVFAPDAPAEPGSRPVVAWGHGSVGLGDSCAPSRSPDDFTRQGILSELLDRGYVVAATDYEGLGTPGPHPWLVGQSEGRGVLDSVRAARQIPEAAASNRFVAIGACQGGGGGV
ncbi:MAG TPA: lipase family protein, partial [Actinomycetota bacterium]|nr:lipase family protein [Actinomycetota bacterium]